jgi:hypothetical protein
MIDLKPILEDLSQRLHQINIPKGDLSDIGNEIGIILGKYISKEMGFEKEDLIAGIKHGISLIDGTH